MSRSRKSSGGSGVGVAALVVGAVAVGLVGVGALLGSGFGEEVEESSGTGGRRRRGGRRGGRRGRKRGEEEEEWVLVGGEGAGEAGGGGDGDGTIRASALIGAGAAKHHATVHRSKRWLAATATGTPRFSARKLAAEYEDLRERVVALDGAEEGVGERLDGAGGSWEAEEGRELADQIAVIARDLPRTFPEERRFRGPAFRAALRRVLAAYALWDREVGYLQGMNFIGGTLLRVFGGNETHAFVVLTRLMADPKYSLRSLFQSVLEGAEAAGAEVIAALEVCDPEAAALLLAAGVTPPFFFEWFFTLFTVVLPADLLEEVWDYVLEHGWIAVVQVTAALLSHAISHLPHSAHSATPPLDTVIALLKGYQTARTADRARAVPATPHSILDAVAASQPVFLDPPKDLVERARLVEISQDDILRWREQHSSKGAAEKAGWEILSAKDA